MFLFMFLEVTHVKVLFITAFYRAHILLSAVSIFKMNLHMLFEISCCGKRFAAFLTYERLLLCMYPFVSIQIRFLIEPLITVFVITFVRFNSLVD